MSDQYRVIGNPIAHSKSPEIHRLFALQTAQSIEYRAELVELGQFADHMSLLFQQGLKGANVTVPFKEDAYRWADTLTSRAQRAGAVNTLYLDGEKIVGDNTDGIGLVTDIKTHCGGNLKGCRILMVGAGGAVRGVMASLMNEAPAELVIVNRSLERAIQLQQDFQDLGDIEAVSYSQLNNSTKSFDWIINATSTGITGDIPPLSPSVMSEKTHCYDMFYCKGDTPFNSWCINNGAIACYDGLGMLVEQAAAAFAIWRNVNPNTIEVLNRLRIELKSH